MVRNSEHFKYPSWGANDVNCVNTQNFVMQLREGIRTVGLFGGQEESWLHILVPASSSGEQSYDENKRSVA